MQLVLRSTRGTALGDPAAPGTALWLSPVAEISGAGSERGRAGAESVINTKAARSQRDLLMQEIAQCSVTTQGLYTQL